MDAFEGTTRPSEQGLCGTKEGMKHAETGQLYRRTRAQQPAFLGHDRLTGKTALKTSNGRAGISPPFCLSRLKLSCQLNGRAVLNWVAFGFDLNILRPLPSNLYDYVGFPIGLVKLSIAINRCCQLLGCYLFPRGMVAFINGNRRAIPFNLIKNKVLDGASGTDYLCFWRQTEFSAASLGLGVRCAAA